MEIVPDGSGQESHPDAAAFDTLASRPITDPSRSSPSRSDALAAALSAAAYLGFQLLVLRLRLTNPLLLTGISLVTLVVTLVFTVRLARSLRSAAAQLAALLISGGIMLPFVALPLLPITSRPLLQAAQTFWFGCQRAFATVPGSRGLLLICFAVALGSVLARMIRELKILLPIAVVLALVDLYVVFGGGLVTQANHGNAQAAKAMSALTVNLTPKLPRGIPAPPPLAVGFADYLFIALFFACFARYRVASNHTFAILSGVLVLYMVIVIVTGLDLPALVPISIVVIGANWRSFQYDREERQALLIAGALTAAVMGALLWYSHRR